VPEAHNAVRVINNALTQFYRSIEPYPKILFVSDPFEKGDWILTFIFRLHYRDASIVVDRVKDKPSLGTFARWSEYEHVFALDPGGLTELSRRSF